MLSVGAILPSVWGMVAGCLKADAAVGGVPGLPCYRSRTSDACVGVTDLVSLLNGLKLFLFFLLLLLLSPNADLPPRLPVGAFAHGW